MTTALQEFEKWLKQYPKIGATVEIVLSDAKEKLEELKEKHKMKDQDDPKTWKYKLTQEAAEFNSTYGTSGDV